MKKILIVEDDPNIAKSLSIRLRAAGYGTVSVTDAVNAVTFARKHEPALILLDISLPAGDGFVIAQRLAGLPDTSGIPVIFLTASRKEGLREQAAELGAVGFFEKPYDADELLQAIGNVIGGPTPVGGP